MLSSCCKHRVAAFHLDQAALAPKSAAVTRQAAIGPDHPVTGDQDGDAIGLVGAGNCTGRLWATDLSRQVRIAARPPCRNALKRLPDPALKRGSAGGQRDRKGAPVPIKELGQLPRGLFGRGRAAKPQVAFRIAPERLQLRRQGLAIGKLQKVKRLLPKSKGVRCPRRGRATNPGGSMTDRPTPLVSLR